MIDANEQKAPVDLKDGAATGIILFAHGARDARWAEPFMQLQQRVQQRAPGLPVTLAFLELMQPDLANAVAALMEQGVDCITVVPVFLGQGGHVRRDLPALIDGLREQHPALTMTVAEAVGEQATVQEAMAAYCLHAAGR
jgi:sirohydrochlorin cobaltochelatase